jgi:repressor LexA
MKEKKPLTKKQKAVYDYLVDCTKDGRIPSVREICKDVGLKSTSTAHLYLKALEDHGLIERDPGLNRCIRIVGETTAKSVPVLGKVAAGNPIVAIEDVECYVTVDKNLSRGKELFALRVRGESMINAGILPDDILIVNRTPVAENGEIVVALVDDSATVKRFYKEDGHFRLQPENDDYEPIIVDDVILLGKVISLIRNY